MKIGVLALQGAVSEHLDALKKLGCDAKEVLYTHDLDGLNGLILPGGESTTFNWFFSRNDFSKKIKTAYLNGMGIFGTCAGCILVAKKVIGGVPSLDLMDIKVKRNAYGRQAESFEADLPVSGFDKPFPAVFIRAPAILSANEKAKILAKVDNFGVMAVQDRLLVTTFHPELTDDLRIHSFFIDILNN